MTIKGGWTPEKVRQRIRTGVLAKRVEDHALGKVEMTKTQLTAALGLLRKTLPDQSMIEHSGTMTLQRAEEMTDDALAHIASGSSARAVEPSNGEPEPSEIH